MLNLNGGYILVYSNVLEALGNTPLIKLSKIVPEDSAEILVKYEGLNVGGSIKTRTAYNENQLYLRDGQTERFIF